MRFHLLISTAALALATPAAAQDNAVLWRVCANEGGQRAIANRVTACTAIIASGRVSQADLAMAHNNRGWALNDQREFARALTDLHAATRLDPRLAWARINRSASYIGLGDHHRAITEADEAIRLEPELAMAWNNRGTARSNLGDHRRAIAELDEAIRLDPRLALAWYNRGVGSERLGDSARALADFNEAIRLNPSYAKAYANRGFVLARLGERNRAMADFDESIRLNPNFALTYLSRAVARNEGGDPAGALTDIDRAERLAPTEWRVPSARGDILMWRENWRRAAAAYGRAIELDPSQAWNFRWRGQAHEELGDDARALADFREALRLAPNNVEARAGLCRLLPTSRRASEDICGRR